MNPRAWKPARGRALTAIALDRGITRLWFERIPWLGDRWLRRRILEHWRRAVLGWRR